MHAIYKDDPKSFEQWSRAARRQEKIWFKKRALKLDYEAAQTNTGGQNQNQRRGQFFWRRTGSDQYYGCYNSNSNSNPARPRLSPRNENTMVTSATIRKASTEREREEYRKAGRCFECGKQGHLARNCRNKRRSIQIEEENPTVNLKGDMSISSFAARIARLFEERQGLRR
jgi:hypothetical protein